MPASFQLDARAHLIQIAVGGEGTGDEFRQLGAALKQSPGFSSIFSQLMHLSHVHSGHTDTASLSQTLDATIVAGSRRPFVTDGDGDVAFVHQQQAKREASVDGCGKRVVSNTAGAVRWCQFE